MNINVIYQLKMLVAHGFMNECRSLHKENVFRYSKTSAEININTIFMLISNNIEGGLIAEFGVKKGTENTQIMLTMMIDENIMQSILHVKQTVGMDDLNLKIQQTDFTLLLKNPSQIVLSKMGRELMNDLFQSLIRAFEENGFQFPVQITH